MTLNHGSAIPFSFPGVPHVRCLFSTVRAGDMALRGDTNHMKRSRENRVRFMREAGFAEWAELRQVHGDAIVPAQSLDDMSMDDLPEADGHFTERKGVGLVIKTADCQPLLFAREDGGAVAALHVGWRGNARGLPQSAVARLCEAFSCEPENLLAVRGPSLGPAAAEFVNFAREWPQEFAPWFDENRETVDLWGLARRQLREAGLRPDRIFSLDLCTRDMGDWFFSHRRGDGGRQISVVWREEQIQCKIKNY